MDNLEPFEYIEFVNNIYIYTASRVEAFKDYEAVFLKKVDHRRLAIKFAPKQFSSSGIKATTL